MSVEQINLDEYVKQQSKLLDELTDKESQIGTTKTEYIKRLREVTKPLVLAGYYPDKQIGDLSSIIRDMLNKHNISFPDNQAWTGLFEDYEKRPTNSRREDSPLPIAQQTGIELIDRLKEVERNNFTDPNTRFSEYFELIKRTTGETLKQVESIIKKYQNAFAYEIEFEKVFPDEKQLEYEIEHTVGKKKKDLEERYDVYKQSQETIYNIENTINNVIGKMQKLLEVLAEQKHTSKLLDERNKITFIEKWNAILCNKLDGLGISAVARRLGIDKKHMSNNINPERNPVTDSKNMHHEYIDWFKAVKIDVDGKQIIFDAKEYFDKQIERGKLGLPFEKLVLKTHDVV